jgi:hypothetical protein
VRERESERESDTSCLQADDEEEEETEGKVAPPEEEEEGYALRAKYFHF